MMSPVKSYGFGLEFTNRSSNPCLAVRFTAQVKIRNLNDTDPRLALRDPNGVSSYLYPLGLNLEGVER